MRSFDIFLGGTFLGNYDGYSEASALQEMCFQHGLPFDAELAWLEYDVVEVV